jgi:8-oxo-dGTP diphosphatase
MLKVGLACIIKDGLVLIGKRTDGRLNWEFPGGKIRLNERIADGIIREAFEELAITISCNEIFHIEKLPDKELYFATAKITEGNPTPIVHSSISWEKPSNLLSSIEFPLANIEATKKLINLLEKI